MNFLDAFILGIVEGVTEFLPISSTAHLQIFQNMLQIPTSEFIKSFQIAIQLGAILSVVYIYRNKILSSFSLYFQKILIAFIPTGLVGFILYKIIKSILLGNMLIVACTILLGGIVILFVEKTYSYKEEDASTRSFESLSTRELLIMGFSQSLAVVPGVSRSLAVIISGRAMGLPKVLVTEFSFLLAIPTMFFATIYDLYKSGFTFEGGQWAVLGLGFLVSFITAMFVVRWLLAYIKTHSFVYFGYYRIVLGIVLLLFLTF